jgi:hypothetical protein
MHSGDTVEAMPRVAGGKAGGRRRWVNVRVLTDDGSYLGRLRLENARTALHDLIADERAYLALWDAKREGEAEVEFVAIHKGVIRAVVLLGDVAGAAAA